jgi:hypothetical protein
MRVAALCQRASREGRKHKGFVERTRVNRAHAREKISVAASFVSPPISSCRLNAAVAGMRGFTGGSVAVYCAR